MEKTMSRGREEMNYDIKLTGELLWLLGSNSQGNEQLCPALKSNYILWTALMVVRQALQTHKS